MLMALSLSSKLAQKGVQAFSLHPGVIFTNLGSHLDWNGDVGIRKSSDAWPRDTSEYPHSAELLAIDNPNTDNARIHRSHG